MKFGDWLKSLNENFDKELYKYAELISKYLNTDKMEEVGDEEIYLYKDGDFAVNIEKALYGVRVYLVDYKKRFLALNLEDCENKLEYILSLNEDVVSFSDYKARKDNKELDDGVTHVHINSVIITGCEGPNDDNRFPFGKEISLEEAQALINKEDYICYINDNCDKCYFQPKFTVNGEEKAVSDYLKYSSELRVDLHDGAKYGYEQISIIEHLKSILEHSGGLENVEIDNKEIPYDKAALEKEYGTREETLKKYVDSHKIELPKGRGCADKTIEQIAVGDIFYDSDYSDYSRSYYYDFYRVTKKTSKSIWLEPLKRQRVEEPVIKDDRKDYQGYQYPSDEVDRDKLEKPPYGFDFTKPFRLTDKFSNTLRAEQGAGHYKVTVYPWKGVALAEEFKMKKSIYAKLNEDLKPYLHEFYDIDGLDSIEMEIVDFGGGRYELDGIEFYLGEDETLENAVDTCIEMEFLPEWEEQGLSSYNVDSIQFDKEEGKGIAYVGLFRDDLDESADKAEELKKIFDSIFRGGKMNCFETKQGVIYFEPQGEKLVFGDATNAGIIPQYEFDYDFEHSFDFNMQGMVDQIMEEEGYPIDESINGKCLVYVDGSDGSDERISLYDGEKLIDWKAVDLDCPTDEFIREEAKKYFDIPDSIKVERPLEIEAPKASNEIARKLDEPVVITRCNNCMTYLDPDVKECPKCKTDAYLMDMSKADLDHQGIDVNKITVEESLNDDIVTVIDIPLVTEKLYNKLVNLLYGNKHSKNRDYEQQGNVLNFLQKIEDRIPLGCEFHTDLEDYGFTTDEINAIKKIVREERVNESLNEKYCTKAEITRFLKSHKATEVAFGRYISEIRGTEKLFEMHAHGSKKIAGTYDSFDLSVYPKGALYREELATGFGKVTTKYYIFGVEAENIDESLIADNDLLNHDAKFRYQMLSRMQQDCEYFLGNGNGYEKHLWAGNVEDQIKYMKDLWNSFEEKPEWLSMEDIEKYEKDMLAKRDAKNESINESAREWVAQAVYSSTGYGKEFTFIPAMGTDAVLTIDGRLSERSARHKAADYFFNQLKLAHPSYLGFTIAFGEFARALDVAEKNPIILPDLKVTNYHIGDQIPNEMLTDAQKELKASWMTESVNEGFFTKGELTCLPKKEPAHKVGDKITINGVNGEIIKVKPMKMSDTSTYQIKLDNGKTVWKYEEEINESLNEDKEDILKKIADEVKAEIDKIYADDKDLLEYFHVESGVKKGHYDDGSDMHYIEVRTELDYNELLDLSEKLDKIVQKYDKYAYFDMEGGGIITAVIDNDLINESLNEAKEYPKMLTTLIKKCWYGDGRFARNGKWTIGLGGYDHGYEVYYDGDTVVQIKPDNEVYFGRDERTVKEICGYDYQQILKAIQEVEPNAFIPGDEYKLIIEYDEEYFNDLWNVIEKYIEDDKVANTESGNGYYYIYSNDEDFLYDVSAEIKENDTENRFNTRIIEV